MAGGVVMLDTAGSSRLADYHDRLTWYVFIVALVAASGGLLFGYDLGVTGGVESMNSFLEKFFPSVYEEKINGQANNVSPYCTYNDPTLQLFTSSLFLAGLVSSLFASYLTRAFGRKITMISAGTCFLIGAGLNAGAQDLTMLIIGRIMLGFGIGFANQVVPMYLSEMAPFKLRGALNQMFQLLVTLGILVAQLINYGIKDWDEGWRLSLGLAAVPALILLIGGILLPESPNSLVERGHDAKGRAVLERLRGTDEVDAEFMDIKDATELANSISTAQSWKMMFTREYSPMLIVTCLISMFQQLTGINAIMFYVPVLFSSLGSSDETALLNTVIIGVINVLATLVAIYYVDKLGRRFWFLEGGAQMILCMSITAVVLGVEFSKNPDGKLPSNAAIGVLVVICCFVAGFAWSWGPLGWLVPSEIQNIETRAAGTSLGVSINFIFSFIMGQCFLSMLCAMEFGVFLFFAAWVLIMSLFIFFCLPETKGVPVERMHVLFARHPFWRKIMGPSANVVVERAATRKEARRARTMDAGKAADGVADVPDMITAVVEDTTGKVVE